MNISDLKYMTRNNTFRKTYYSVDIPLRNFLKHISLHTDIEMYEKGTLSWNSFFDKAVPSFQRSNDKWTKEMQISYLENIICGYKSPPILLYTINEGDGGCFDAMLLDGLQRVTAIADFLQGEIKLFDKYGGFTYAELEQNKIVFIDPTIQIRKYDFQNEKEVLDFYIKMNENITHSKADIAKAKLYLKNCI